ncbi:MAG: cyclic nucleotide-binding domain-containing protein, partial [Anaerolineales bacterium]|nr:cyclic nucleotide-binding domain-containing protein [Anaerolineales bacterium]
NVIISDGELIHEAVSRSMPQLRHRHMLEMTKLAKALTFKKGATILDFNQPVENLYFIVRGTVDVFKKSRGASKPLTQLGADQFFGDIELLRGGKSIASVKASEKESVELLTLPRVDFWRILAESPITK